jgi:predicted DNA-binding WGR domain protein
MLSYRWEHPEKQRFYRVIVSKDLLGDLVLTKVWGGINQSSGKISHHPCSSQQIALTTIESLLKARAKKGYLLINNKDG